jgi:hypothetical protein
MIVLVLFNNLETYTHIKTLSLKTLIAYNFMCQLNPKGLKIHVKKGENHSESFTIKNPQSKKIQEKCILKDIPKICQRFIFICQDRTN